MRHTSINVGFNGNKSNLTGIYLWDKNDYQRDTDQTLQHLLGKGHQQAHTSWYILIWVCLKMGYTPNYSHLVGMIMIINHWV